ncbi:LIM homeobox transcription factor 1-beta.1-like isoform X2 [Panonychus citri]|nr:LIM homeobox transcription factor 1-beta.1-like isoform X2 [Panonychus citri]
MVMRALDSIFHLDCFTCVDCGKQLKKGDQYVFRSGRLFCRPDFEKELAILQMSTQTSENAVVPNNNQNSPIPSGQGILQTVSGSTTTTTVSTTNLVNQRTESRHEGRHDGRHDGRRGPKRPRTILTTAQRRAFKASFEVSQKPCRKVRESLAKETGLSVRIVQVWFQNQRAKLKKIQRKQQQLASQSHQQSHNGEGDKSSLDKMSPYSRLGHSGSGHLTDSSSIDSPSTFSVAPIQYLSHSPDDDSYYSPHGEGYSKGDLGMDSDASLGGLDDVLHGNGANSNGGDESLSSSHHPIHPHPLSQAQLISNHPHHHHHHHHHNSHQGSSSSMDNNSNNNNNGNSLFGSSMTPIDRLCSMSNSYFNSSTECECLGPTN